MANTITQVLLAGRDGRIIADVSPRIGATSWRLNNVGKTTLSFSKRDPKLTAENVGIGNLVLIQFDNGLPPWGGVIDLPGTWGRDEYTLSVYSGEYLLSHRTTGKNRVFSSATIGDIFSQIVSESSDVADSLVQVGSVWGGVDLFSPEYHYANVLGIIQKDLIKKYSTADFYIEPKEIDGSIVFVAHLYERRGTSKPNTTLIEGHNVSELRRTEQGPVFNSVDVAGADISGGTSGGWGDGRLVSHLTDADSINLIGLREGSLVRPAVRDQQSLDSVAASELDRMSVVKNGIGMYGLNRPPAPFSEYDVGDDVRLESYSYGFDGFEANVRMHGREFFPETGRLGLLVREVE